MVSPSPPSSLAEPLGAPITALPAFTPSLTRRASSVWSASSEKGSAAHSAKDGLPTMLLTPSFANRGFVTRFSPLATTHTQQPPSDGVPTVAPASSARSGRSLGARLRQASPSLWEQHGRRLSAPSGYTETAGESRAEASDVQSSSSCRLAKRPADARLGGGSRTWGHPLRPSIYCQPGRAIAVPYLPPSMLQPCALRPVHRPPTHPVILPTGQPCRPPSFYPVAASEGATPSFQLQAPSGLTDSEDESEGEGETAVESRRRPSLGAAGVRPLSPAEVALSELTTRLEVQLRVGGWVGGRVVVGGHG
jgi:hypothetical protein